MFYIYFINLLFYQFLKSSKVQKFKSSKFLKIQKKIDNKIFNIIIVNLITNNSNDDDDNYV